MSFRDKITGILMKISTFANTNKYLSAIVGTFTETMPFVMMGSFATLFATVLCNTKTGLAQFPSFKWITTIQPALNAINFATVTCLTLLFVYLFGENLGKKISCRHILEVPWR